MKNILALYAKYNRDTNNEIIKLSKQILYNVWYMEHFSMYHFLLEAI